MESSSKLGIVGISVNSIKLVLECTCQDPNIKPRRIIDLGSTVDLLSPMMSRVALESQSETFNTESPVESISSIILAMS